MKDKTENFSLNAKYIFGEGAACKGPHGSGARCFPFCVVVYVEYGEYRSEIDGVSYLAREGEAIIIPEGVRHTISMDRHGKLSWAHVCYHWEGRDVLSYYNYPIIAKGEQARAIGRSCLELAAVTECISFEEKLKNAAEKNGLLYNMLSSILDQGKPRVPHLSAGGLELINVLDFINKNLDKKITVEKLAEIAGLAQTVFTLKFKSAVGESPIDYVIWQRMQAACRMLFAEEMSVKEVAAALGYDDPLYFSKLFKKSIGIAPSSYREVIISQLP